MIGGAESLLILVILIYDVSASAGERSQLFINCLRGCRHHNCTEGKCTYLHRNDLNEIGLNVYFQTEFNSKMASNKNG